MKSADVDLDAYFQRTGYSGERAATLPVLQRLHELHARSIPFENLSPLLGEPVALDAVSLQEKLVRGGRGGYCFEHNLLLLHMLLALGFEARGLAARVLWNAAADARPARSHMLLKVRVPEGEYIADVGFGGQTLTRPLQLRAGIEQPTALGTFRLVQATGFYVLELQTADGWAPLYSFDLQEQQLADYELVSWYLCNHPRSIFVNGLMAARAASDCRHALRNNRYSVRTAEGLSRARLLRNADELMRTLTEVFGVRLPHNPALRKKLEAVVEAEAGSRAPQ